MTTSSSSADAKPPSEDVYGYLDDGGSGFSIYVFDSGIAHLDEFKTADGTDRAVDELHMSDEFSFEDVGNHGTRVATAIGGTPRGIARAATLRSVKFSKNGMPRASRFADALQEIIRKHNLRSTDPAFGGSICNFSEGMKRTDAAYKAINDAHEARLSMVASAGNSGSFPGSTTSHMGLANALHTAYRPATSTAPLLNDWRIVSFEGFVILPNSVMLFGRCGIELWQIGNFEYSV